MTALLEATALDALRMLLAGLTADALEGIDAIRGAALGADRTIRPNDAFQLRKGCGLISEVICVQDGHDKIFPLF
jgi:hypothetical protein